MKKEQKGFASALVIVIILLIIVGIWWAYDKSKTQVNYLDESPNTENPITNTGTSSGSSSGAPVLSPNTPTPATGAPTVISGNSSVFPGGTEYRSPYGLTLALPANWQTYALTKNSVSYGGVTPTDSTTIRLASGPVLTINVFTKEQWNSIKTQENAANQNVNSLGEGEYLGENATYIYSFLIHDLESEVRQVLANIIRF